MCVFVCVFVTDVCPAYVRFHGVDYASVRCAVNVRWSQRNSLHYCTVNISFSAFVFNVYEQPIFVNYGCGHKPSVKFVAQVDD